jgi:hypothetical protein
MMSMLSPQDTARVVLIGVGATAVMDLVVLLLQRFGVPAPNWSFVGRWIGHLARGRFAHASIAKAAPIHHELGLGWLTHYAVGIAYAGLLVMQPAMGNGFAAAKTSAPLKNCLRSLANHVAFGTGLYAAGALIEWLTR